MVILAGVLCPAPASAQLPIQPRDAVMWSAILSAEDSRPAQARALGPLAGGLRYPDPEIRRLTVRGLGRLERDSMRSDRGILYLTDLISFALHDSSATVRAEAANALAQAVSHGNPGPARDSLVARLKNERDPRVRGATAEALGRLPYRSSPSIEAALLEVSSDTSLAAVLGAARGYEAFYRAPGRTSAPGAQTVTRLKELARFSGRGRGAPARADSVARVRRLAVGALTATGMLDPGIMQSAATDADPQVRRLAMMAAGGPDSAADRARLVSNALRDESPLVRYDALRVYGQRLKATGGCGPILQAVNDKSPHVVLLAIDLLGGGCDAQYRQQAVDRLVAFAKLLTPAFVDRGANPAPSWHQSAHAVVSLAHVAPDRADSLLPAFVGHTTWWVRVYAARAATVLKENAVLTQLAYDANDNVREAAIRGLSQLEGHAADSVYIAALSRKDYQLQITAARALDSTSNPAPALAALNAALLRVTGENRETSRDARMALLRTIGSLGGPEQGTQIQVYLYDWDPAIATETARMLSQWTGTPQEAAPNALPYSSLPALASIAQLARSRAVFHMRGGASFEMTLRPFDAPTNVERFARLVRSGYFDGLTFHRVVPNFVIQGGSPGANEYWGDGPFTRDELTAEAHVRGTVGISTRGRDTGDGQIFVNLVDNPRLDHNYTIIGEVAKGMEVVDAVLEGATIEKVEIVEVK